MKEEIEGGIILVGEECRLYKWLGKKRIAELWCLPLVEVLELPWDDKIWHDILVVDVETCELFYEVKEEGKADI